MAAFLDRSATVALLLQRGVDVNAVGYHYGTALQAASRCGHIKMVRSLLEAGANVNILQGRHQTALCAAIVGCHVDVVKTLIKAGADTSLHFVSEQLYPNDHARTPPSVLQLAARARCLNVVEILLRAGADVHEDVEGQNYPLITACGHGDLEIVMKLLDAGSPVNVCGKKWPRYAYLQVEDASPLHKAATKGRTDIVRLLVASGADLKHVGDGSHGYSSYTALDAAANRNCKVPQRNTQRPRGFSVATWKNCNDGGAECEIEFGLFGNALHLAAFSGNASLVQLLLDRGADINAYGGHFGSALFATLEGRDLSALNLLLERRVHMETTFNGAITPPHWACRRRLTGAIRILLECGANSNARDDQKRTPLSYALSAQAGSLYRRPRDSSSQETAVITLLKYGKDIEISQDDLITSATIESNFVQPEPL